MLVFPLAGCEGDNTNEQHADNGYYIENLSVKIDASKGDRSMLITEEFTYVFLVSSHGFYRDIPVNSGEKIRDIKVGSFLGSTDYHISHTNGQIRIRVGDEDSFVPLNMPVACKISYTMVTPKITDKPDVLLINAIGQGFSCAIKNASVEVLLPNTSQKTDFYVGKWGSNNSDEGGLSISYNNDKTQYNIALTEPLAAFNGLTVDFSLSEGSLSSYFDRELLITLIISLSLVALAVILKLIFGKSLPITPITNFYPPSDDGKQLSPLEIGYIIDNKCASSDVCSLIFYWASKGHILIGGEDGKDCYLSKIDELNDAPAYEKDLYNKIFESGDTVSVESLTDKTYKCVQAAQVAVKQEYTGSKSLFKPSVKGISIIMSVIACLVTFFVVFSAYIRVNSFYFNVFSVFSVIPVALSSFLGSYIVNNWIKLNNKRKKYFIGFIVITLLSSLIFVLLINHDVFSLAETFILFFSVTTSAWIAPFICSRTNFYNSKLNEVVGFRDFLLYAEKDKLETMLKENPQYYYDVLPYANVLGVSDIWQDKFAAIAVQPPAYWHSNTLFNIIIFNSFYRSAFTHISSTAISAPSSSSRSGGGFGGGFGGGGFGGGGGGRW